MPSTKRRPKQSKPVRSPLRIDPTRTITLRKGIVREMRRRFARIKFEIHQLLVERDVLGIIADRRVVNSFCPTGIGGGVDPSCSPNQDRGPNLQSYRSETKALFASLPSQAQTRIKANVSSIRHFSSVEEVTQVVASRSKALSDRLVTTGHKANGAYSPTTGELILDGPGKQTGGQSLSVKEVHAHEIAHALDGRKGDRISETPEWRSAWEKELKGGALSKYGASSPSEGFAEFGRAAWASDIDLSASFPVCARLWEGKGYLRQRHGISNYAPVYPLLPDLFDEWVEADGWLVDCVNPSTENAFCPTGPAGGIDPTCSPGGASKIYSDIKASLSDVSIESVRERAKALSVLSKGELSRVLTDLGYPKPASKKEALERLLDNLTSLWISAQQVKKIGNSFCPTGVGGGIDPSCSPKGHAPGAGLAHGGEAMEHVAHAFRDHAEALSHLGHSIGGSVSTIGSAVAALKLMGAKVEHAEHVVKSYISDKIGAAVSRLPLTPQRAVRGAWAATKLATSAAFITYTASQSFAERISVERGYSSEQARRLRGVLSTIDVAIAKPVALTLGPTASFAPVGSLTYLAYSTARDPMATLRSAKRALTDWIPEQQLSPRFGQGAVNEVGNEDVLDSLAAALEAHAFDDYYIALFSVALDATKDLGQSIEAANKAYADEERIRGTTSNAQDWRFVSRPEKVKLFQRWLRQQFADQLRNKSVEDLWQRYVEEGFKKGAGRAFEDSTRAERFLSEGSKEKLDFYQGTKSEFLRGAFGRPESVEKVKLLAGRSYSDLEGVTEEMSTRMTRILTDGLVQGQHPLQIARTMAQDLDIGQARAERIARTEIIRAHAEGQLQAFEALGVEELGVAVEWSTAGDNKVCPRCSSLQGIVLKISEARTKVPIPLHPDCRCAYIPSGLGEDTKGQKRTKKQIDKALKKADIEETVSKDRPESVLNEALIRLDDLVGCLRRS